MTARGERGLGAQRATRAGAQKSAGSPRSFPEAEGGSAVDRVYRELETLIVTMRLAPGSVVSEAELGRMLGVSRTPVGEALQRLAREGLVNILPRRGILVSELDVVDQLRLLQFRREVSRFVARSAARRAREAQRSQMEGIAARLHRAAESGDTEALLGADKEFHDALAACADNPHAARSMESMDALSRRFFFAHQSGPQERAQSSRLHAAIAHAIFRGDEDAACRASDELSDWLEAFARATIDAST